MDLDDIRLFAKVAELKSFVAAANELRIQTSLLSRRVARLEASLGVRLLQRTTRSVSLTAEGQRFLEETSLGLNQLNSAIDALYSVHGAPKGKVRITSPIEIGQFLVETIMQGFFLKYPEINIEWDLMSTNNNLVENGIDLSIYPQHSSEQSLIEKKIGTLSTQIYCSPQFKIPFGKKPSIEELENTPWVVFTRGSFDNQKLKIQININGVEKEIRPKNIRFRTNSLTSARHAITQGLGIGLLPSIFSDVEVTKGKLLPVLPNYIFGQAVDFYAVYPSKKYLPPKVRVLLDWLTDNFPKDSNKIISKKRS